MTEQKILPFSPISVRNEQSDKVLPVLSLTAGGAVTLTFQFQMEPHYKLPGLLIVYHFRALHDATTFNIATGFFGYGKRYALVSPVL